MTVNIQGPQPTEVALNPGLPDKPLKKRRSLLGGVLRHGGLVLSSLVLLLVLLWAVVPGLFTDADPLVGDGKDRFLPPSGDHLFGTDQFGRDVFARIVDGAWLSVSGVVVAVALAW